MTLLDSLLDAIVRLDGDALVMHVGEKPYVVTTSSAMSAHRGPLAWGQVELSSRVLTPDAVLSMVGQILPADQRSSLDELGAIEHDIASPSGIADRFSVVAARGGDDIWLELRRHPAPAEAPADVAPAAAAADASQAPAADASAAESATTAVGLQEPPAPPELRVQREEEQGAPSAPVQSDRTDDETAIEQASAEALPVTEQEAVRPEAQVETFDSSETIEEVQQLEELDAHREARVPIFDEVTHEQAQHVEHFVIPVRDDEGAEDRPEAREAVELVEPEPQHAPTEEDVDAMLAATAASLLAANLKSDTSEAEPDEQVQHDFAPASFEVVSEEEHEEEHNEADLTSALDEIPEPAAAGDVDAGIQSNETEIHVETTAALPVPPRTDPSHVEPRIAASLIPTNRAPGRGERPDAGGRVDDERLVQVLKVAAERGASTVYVVAQSQPMIRVDGEIAALDGESALTAADIDRLVASLAPPRPSGAAVEPGAEWISEVPQVGRVRCVTFRDHRGPGLIFRLTSAASISAEHLNLSPAIRELSTLADGLVLITGARGSGKSTLLNSFVDLINRTRSEHVITVETEIGFVHESKRSFISQREAGDPSAGAINSALREDPDVLLVEDVQSADAAMAALHAAESGRLVFASITAASSGAALEAFVNLVPEAQRGGVRTALAGALRAVVSQLLLRKASGGRVTARELLLNSPAVSASIRTGDAKGIASALDAGERYGMVSLNEAIAGLVQSGSVHAAEAYRRAPDRQTLLASLARDGVDTSFAERMAVSS